MPDPAAPPASQELSYIRAVNEALRWSLAEYPEAILFGEDVALPGGVFGAAKGLHDEFGERVFDTPLTSPTPTRITHATTYRCGTPATTSPRTTPASRTSRQTVTVLAVVSHPREVSNRGRRGQHGPGAPSSQRFSAGDELIDQDDHCKNQQQVQEATGRERRHQPEDPEDEKDDDDGVEHVDLRL